MIKYKFNKIWVLQKNKYKLLKLLSTVTKNFNCDIIRIFLDQDLYYYKIGKNYFIYPKHIKLINRLERKTIIAGIQKEAEDYQKKLLLSKETKISY